MPRKERKVGKSSKLGAPKSSLFKKGGWNPSKERSTQSSDTATCSHLPDSSEKLQRVTKQEALDIQHIRSSGSSELDQNQDVLGYRLRPKPEKEEKDPATENTCAENLIVSVEKLTELVNHGHAADCRRSNMEVNIEKRIGLCVYVSLKCTVCNYQGPVIPLSGIVKKARGPPAGVLNEMAVLPVLKAKVGIEDTRTVLTCLNIRAPSSATLHKKFTNMGGCQVDLNKQEMNSNQKHADKCLKMAGQTDSSADVAFDVCYSSRPQGGSEKATQSAGVMVENVTSQKLTVAVAVGNKLCRRKGCDHQQCSKTFATDASIASSERVLLHRTLDDMENEGVLNVASVTTDGGTQSAKAIWDWCRLRQKEPVIHYKCLVHKLRAVERNLKQLNLKSIPKTYEKSSYLKKLASLIRARVRLELSRRMRSQQFVQQARAAILNIIRCISNNHGRCRHVSLACTRGLADPNSRLPYKQPLALSAADKRTVEEKLSQMFDEKSLQEVSKLYNTNKCESINSTIFQYAPKSGCYPRNFACLVHSAIHSRTLGPGHSIIKLAKAAGLRVPENSVMYKQLKAKDTLRRYDKKRKSSAKYKETRFFQRKRRNHRTLFQDSVYSSENAASSSASDHSYGLKF